MKTFKFIFVMVFIFLCISAVSVLSQTMIEISPQNFNFGEIEIGNSMTTIITVTNISAKDVTIKYAYLMRSPTGFNFSLVNEPDLPVIIGSFCSMDWIIQYKPSSIGQASVIFEVVSDGGTVRSNINGIGRNLEIPPDEQIENFIGDIENLVEEGDLTQGQGNAVTQKLEDALQKLNDGDIKTAINQLRAFINQVRALINSGQLTKEEGDALIVATNEIIEEILNRLNKPIAKASIKSTSSSVFILKQNFPNPFNPKTTIHFVLPDNNYVKLNIYNTLGQKIDVLIEGYLSQGYHEVEWNANNYPSGLYVYRIETTYFHDSKKMFLLK